MAIAYGISWLIWMPNVLSHYFKVPWQHSDWLHFAGGLGPFLSALLTTHIMDGKKGLQEYFRQKLLTVPAPKWILIGFLMPIIFFLVPMIGLGLISGQWPNFTEIGLNSKLPYSNQVLIWLAWCNFYGLGEEGGWRGLLFPELDKKYNSRMATLYTAFIWAPWHLPVFFYDKDLGSMGLVGTIGWVIGLVFGSFLLGWLLKQAKLNLWPVILWHGTFKFFSLLQTV